MNVKIVFISILICFMLSLILFFGVKIFFNMKKREEKKENFSNDLIQSESLRLKLREDHAIQSCDILRPQNTTDISSTSHDNMRSILDGHRLNTYKPKDNNPLDGNLDRNMSYCYMYNDAQNNMKDYMLYNNGCSLDNPIFENVDFITNVYETEHKDNTHTLPLKKCVVEIDPQQVTPSNLDNYWSKWGSEICNGISGPIQNEIRSTSNNIYQLSNDIVEIIDSIKSAEDQFDLLSTSNDICSNTIIDENSNLQSFTNRYNTEYDLFSSNKLLRDEKYSTYNQKLDTKRDKESTLENLLQSLGEIQTQNNACQVELSECQNERSILETDKNNVLILNNELIEEEKNKRQTYNDLYDDYSKIMRNESQCRVDVEKLTQEVDEKRESFLRKQDAFNSCDDNRSIYKEKSEEMAESLSNMKEKEQTCIDDRKEIREDYEHCELQNEKCNYLENEYKNTLERLEKIKEKVEDCQQEREELETTKQELLNTNLDYYNELDRIIYNNYQSEKEVYQNEMKQIIDFSDQILDEYTKNLNDLTTLRVSSGKCQNKRDIVEKIQNTKGKNSDLRFRIEVLESQICNYCRPTVQQCARKFPNENALCTSYL